MKIGVVGCGAYSLAISIMLNKNTKDITIWSESEEKANIINKDHQIDSILKNIKIPENIKVTTSLEETVKNKDIIFLIVAAPFMKNTVEKIKDYLSDDSIICIGTKGIEQYSYKFMDELVLDTKLIKNLAVISGPSFAIDLASEEPVALTIASKSSLAIDEIKSVLSCNTLKLRENEDIIGTEICGSIKNVIAIAAGIINGLGYKESTQAFLITEAIHDIKELIKAFNGNANTVLSYAGIGDLLLTCTSTKSRNFSFGRLLGQNISKDEIDNYLKNNTVEGYYTLKSIYELIKNKDIKLDVIDVVYDIVFHNKDPHNLIEFLISKE